VLNKDQAVQISRLSSGKTFIGKRKKFIFNAFVQIVAVIKLRVNNRCGNGTRSFEVKTGADTTKFTNVIITRLRER